MARYFKKCWIYFDKRKKTSSRLHNLNNTLYLFYSLLGELCCLFVCMYGGGGGKKRESRSNPNEYCSTGKNKNKKTPRYEKTLTKVFPLAIYFLAQVYFGERHFNCIGRICYFPVSNLFSSKALRWHSCPRKASDPTSSLAAI